MTRYCTHQSLFITQTYTCTTPQYSRMLLLPARVVLGLVREALPVQAREPHEAREHEHEQPDHVPEPEPCEPGAEPEREEEPARHADHEHAHKCGAPSLAGAERVAHPDCAADADAEQRHEREDDQCVEDAVGRDHDARVRQEACEERDRREAEHLQRRHEHARDAELGDLGHERHGFLRPPAGPRGLEHGVVRDHGQQHERLDEPAERVRGRDTEVPERRVERQHVRRRATHEPGDERRGHEREHNRALHDEEEHAERDHQRVDEQELARDVRDRRVLSERLEELRAAQEPDEHERHADCVHEEAGLAEEPELGHLLGAECLRAERVDRGREAVEQPGDEEHLHEAREAERREDLRALARVHVSDHHREQHLWEELEQRRHDLRSEGVMVSSEPHMRPTSLRSTTDAMSNLNAPWAPRAWRALPPPALQCPTCPARRPRRQRRAPRRPGSPRRGRHRR
ncbi:hypothetical protein PybrP1_006540 [[Pythium] brassicae (nom. inval.)]|nr:hypothetical protein PybrP1_006540 [[Pythium] brassicae (nom. inval.)]